MAGKRISQSAIDWAKLAERVPEAQRTKLHSFKSKSDAYMRRMLANPENPPKIDWAFYKKTVPISGMVDNFQKQYEALSIPYPADTVTSHIEAQEKEVTQAVAEFKKESSKRVAAYRAEAERLGCLLPYEQMTMEDYYNAHPDVALDAINRPTYWPHNPEEQVGYVAKDAPPSH